MSMINDIIQSAVNNVQSTKKEFDAQEWGKGKQQDREFAYKTQDEMATKITENGGNYKTYLNVQSRFPTYSVGNALLVTAQNPKATQLKDAESWKKDNIHFAGKPNKIIILEQGNIYEMVSLIFKIVLKGTRGISGLQEGFRGLPRNTRN